MSILNNLRKIEYYHDEEAEYYNNRLTALKELDEFINYRASNHAKMAR